MSVEERQGKAREATCGDKEPDSRGDLRTVSETNWVEATLHDSLLSFLPWAHNLPKPHTVWFPLGKEGRRMCNVKPDGSYTIFLSLHPFHSSRRSNMMVADHYTTGESEKQSNIQIYKRHYRQKLESREATSCLDQQASKDAAETGISLEVSTSRWELRTISSVTLRSTCRHPMSVIFMQSRWTKTLFLHFSGVTF